METENGTIPVLDMETFKQHEDFMDYVDDDFLVATTIDSIHNKKTKTVRMNIFLLVGCVEGRMQLDINNKTYTLTADEAVVCLPTTIISSIMVSPEYKMRLIGFSTSFLQRILKVEKDTERVMAFLYNNPVQRMEDRPDYIHCYTDLLMAKVNEPPQRYKKEILQHLFSAIFSEMMCGVFQKMDGNQEAQPNAATAPGIKRADIVFHEFIKELSTDNGMHRSVSYYADRLCYSPKYLSSVIRQVSGRTALDWINEAAVEQIKHRLKFSNKSIKEVAEDMNFSNQSFFGKYVKAHLGVSPARYREMPEGKEEEEKGEE
ncbi:MAG: helix-turn-helix domain-containing protein [Bacteroides sp.]|nr:helix-turn-helix domain-containing protein [Bacteroides sp.]